MVIVLNGARPATASLPIGDPTADPYQLIKGWRGFPRAIRLALKAVGLGAVSFARLALTLGRAGVPCTIRPGHGLELALTTERPTQRPAVKVQIARHPEWAGLETMREDLLHSP
jgi:hypothetical protein